MPVGVVVFALLFAGPPNGDAVIRAKAGKSEIVITVTSRLAGAIHSLTWDGREFIDSFDHGRQLQSAANFDAGAPIGNELFNPTEAGSRRDGTGATSSSRLLEIKASGNELRTVSQMAFWLAPGEKSDGKPARNTAVLSNHRLAKRVTIGRPSQPQVIEYEAVFTVPADERHRHAVFEALTGYMPPDFSVFHAFDAAKGELVALSDGPGEQNRPVVFSTPDGHHGMGIFSPQQPSKGFEAAGYGRFRFEREKVVKWNCVFRTVDDKGVPAGDHRFRMFVAVGTRQDVLASLAALAAEFAPARGN